MVAVQYIYQSRQSNILKYVNPYCEVHLNNIQKFQMLLYINRLLQSRYVISVNSESYTKPINMYCGQKYMDFKFTALRNYNKHGALNA